jgi:hypothetical protein
MPPLSTTQPETLDASHLSAYVSGNLPVPTEMGLWFWRERAEAEAARLNEY